MKPNRDANALAAALSSAAAAPLPLPPKHAENVVEMPARAETSPTPRAEARPSRKAPRQKAIADTVAITLRPDRELLNRYTLAAAERMKKEGRAVTAQEIMLEVLQRGRPQVEP